MPSRTFCWILFISAYFLIDAPARADLLDSLNQLRSADCAPSAGLPALQHSSELDALAQEWSKGSRLAEAVAHTAYRGNKLASMQVQGATEDARVAAALRENYCNILTDARYAEVGLFRREADVWIVVSAPPALAGPGDLTGVRKRVLELVNEARRHPRNCGDIEFRATNPVQASNELDNAAQVH